MAASEKLEEFVAELGRRTGIPQLGFDGNGVCALALGDVVLHLYAEPGAEEALFYVPLGPVPDEHRARLQRRMLEANLVDSLPGALGLDPRSGEVMLAVRPRPDGMAYAGFEDLLGRLAAAAQQWKAELRAGASVDGPAEPWSFPIFGIRA